MNNKKINYLKKMYLTKGKIKIQKSNDGFIIENKSSKPSYIFFLKLFRHKSEYINIKFKGDLIKGEGPKLLKVNYRLQNRGVFEFNKEILSKKNTSMFYPVIKVAPNSKFSLNQFEFEEKDFYEIVDVDNYKGDVLVITPMYPSDTTPYSATFVYSKVNEYLKAGIKTDVVVLQNVEDGDLEKYVYKDKEIIKTNYNELREILQSHNYKKILIHFINYKIYRTLEKVDLEDKDIYIYCHGADTHLFDENIFGRYFVEHHFTNLEIVEREKNLQALKKLNEMENVTWIFNTEWNKINTRKVTNLPFAKSEVIPCIINKDEFPFEQRDKELRKKILIMKKMDNNKQYAVDIAVRTILELSHKDYFNELEFRIVGEGKYQKELLNPVRKFKNVIIDNKFYQHDKMDELMKQYGILLVPSRFDTQGVIAGEAAMSGMVLVASKGTGMSSMLDENIGTFFEQTDYQEAAKIIEKLYYNEDEFVDKSLEFRKNIEKTANEKMIKKEISLLKKKPLKTEKLKFSFDKLEEPILSIVVPSYNVEKYLRKSIMSLITAKNANYLEVIIVNDGSKDDTVKIANSLKQLTTLKNGSIVKVIDKENGGHGSTINAGLKVAKGKYFRLMDGDDVLNTESLEKHINYLLNCNVDLVLTDYIEDRATYSEIIPKHNYQFMEDYKIYNFDDLCYEKYGFIGYGPILSTTTVKTENLRKVKCELTEHCFYVDMEFNYFVTEASKTVVHQPIELYQYYIGRGGQSIAKNSYMKNYEMYKIVMKSLIKKIEMNKLSKMQEEHFVRAQLNEVFRHSYVIAVNYFENANKFREVNNIIKKHPRFYNDTRYQNKVVKKLRKTNGHFLKTILFIEKIKEKIH